MKNATVLVVEDEKELRTILAKTLSDNGFIVLEAKDGKEGLQVALHQRPDLIMLDLLMPIMGGMETLRRIREDQWGKDVPVMILTNLSADDESLVQAMVDQHPECYIIKSTWSMQDIVKKAQETIGARK